VAAIAANARQYCPAANGPWEAAFSGLFSIEGGAMNTSLLDGIGLGFGEVAERLIAERA
jgi:hypothetical protein